MPIIDLQRRVAEIGRIRLGEVVETRDGGTRPRALGRFRFTSPKRSVIETIAAEHGGDVRDWSAPAGDQFEVVTHAREIEVVLIPAEVGFSQWLELWDGSGCVRRCDGITEVRGDAPRPCVCAAQGDRICRYTTRLSVLLPVFADFGSWRLETHSYYAAGEMRTALDLALSIAARRGDHFSFATLRVEDRVTKRPGEKPHRFPVPVLDVRLDPAALASGGPVVDPARTLPAGPENALERTTGPETALAALSAVEYPTPTPRIDRGAPGPGPHPIEDRAATPPAAPSPAVAKVDHRPSSPEPSRGTVVEDALTPEVVEAAGHAIAEAINADAGEVVAFKRAGSEPPPAAVIDPDDERTKTLRRLFAFMNKTLWPNLEQIDRDERRHAVAILETANRRGEVVASFSDLTLDELVHVETRLHDLEAGRITMRAVPRGYWIQSRSGRTAVITKNDAGEWTYEVHDQPPATDDEGETF